MVRHTIGITAADLNPAVDLNPPIHSNEKRLFSFKERYAMVLEWHDLKSKDDSLKLSDFAESKGLWPKVLSNWILVTDVSISAEEHLQRAGGTCKDRYVKHPEEEKRLLAWWRNERRVHDRYPSRKELNEQMDLYTGLKIHFSVIQKFCQN